MQLWGRVAAVIALLALSALLARAAAPSVALDREPRPTQKPYAPADGQVVSVTPPPFIWVPAGKDRSYVLRVSRFRAFPNDQTHTYRPLRRSVFVPRDTLPAGEWFWRYGVETESGTVLGRPRPFAIAEDARPFPFPDWEAVVRNVPRQRPRLFFPGKRLQQVRAWARGELKPAVESLVRSCEQQVGKELVAEPGYRPRGPESGPWAVNVMRGTRAYDWTCDLFTGEERAKIEANMRVRAAQFLTQLQRLPFESDPYNSHAAREARFLAVLLPHRMGAEDELPRVELLTGSGAVGVQLTAADGARDVVAFRVDRQPQLVTCGGIESRGRVFAQGTGKDGKRTRHFTHPQP